MFSRWLSSLGTQLRLSEINDTYYESFAQEHDLLFNAKKTVCILFSGRSRRFGNPPPLYMNNVLLKWTKSAKYLDSIVTYDLTESE